MVTHELLGTIKGANAEVEMLKAALIDMTAQRDARMDMSALAAVGAGSGMSAADEVEKFQTLKVRNGGDHTELIISTNISAKERTVASGCLLVSTSWGWVLVCLPKAFNVRWWFVGEGAS